MKIDLTSAAFGEGEIIPKQCTADGKDISPALHWSSPPPGTKSFVLICDDPDAPRGTWVHWVMFNIAADQRELPEAVPTQEEFDGGAKQGTNDFKKIGYGGPSPPPGKPHRYFFKLYALGSELSLQPGAAKADLEKAMAGHILGKAELMGRYKR